MTTEQTYERMRKLVDDAASLSFPRKVPRVLRVNGSTALLYPIEVIEYDYVDSSRFNKVEGRP